VRAASHRIERKTELSTQITIALVILLGLLWTAHRAVRQNLERVALALVVLSPLLAGGASVALSDLLHRTPSERPAAVANPTEANATPAAEPSSAATPDGGRVAELRSQAEAARRSKNYAVAMARFKDITQVAPFDPDGWADLGDAQAAASGGDLTAGGAAIDRALELDAEHPKALWLKASLKLQLKDYAGAADLWQRLLKILPPESSDAKIVQSNLDESRRLAGTSGATR
jgi:cytochrome c-type biogenesis protein CcmH/NrfG